MEKERPSLGAAGTDSAVHELLDRKLQSCGLLAQQQQLFLSEVRELLSVAQFQGQADAVFQATPNSTVSTSEGSRVRTVSKTSGPPPSWRQNSPLVLPVLNVFQHGNSISWLPPNFAKVPSLRRGFLPWLQGNMARLVNSSYFEPFMACVIGLNALNIGVAIDLELRGESTTLNSVLEGLFLVVFTVELLLRAGGRGLRSLLTKASALDSFIILVSLVQSIVKMLSEEEQVARVLDQIMILRMARLLRLTRLIACMESLWKLVQGLVRCVATMTSACVLMSITIYIFACFGAELIAKPYLQDEEVGGLLRQHFSTMPRIVLTLFRFVSMDSTAQIYAPLVEHSPALALYFWLLLMIVPIALLNLITAILVQDVISTVQADEEMKQIQRRRQLKHLTPALKQLFVRLDKNRDGHVQIKEVLEAVQDGLELPDQLKSFLNPARMLDLFDALDADKSGDLSEEEFVDGLTYASMTDVAIETIQILHLLRTLKQDHAKFSAAPWRQQPLVSPSALCSPYSECSSEGALAI